MRLPRWKKEQKKRKERKRLFVIRCILLVISIILLIGIGRQVYRSLRKSLWDGENRINFVLVSQPILVVSLAPSEKIINIFSIPDQALIEVIHGYGYYRVKSIFALGEIEGRGGELLVGSLREYLGVLIDAYALNHELRITNYESRIKKFLKECIISLLKGEGETNLTKWDLARLWWQINKVRPNKITLVDLGQTSASREVVLPDGTKAIEINSERIDRLVNQLFKDEKIVQEDLAIAVLNGTTHFGLARKAARLITNIGGQVVEVGNIENLKSQILNLKCEIRSPKRLKNAYTIQKLMRAFDCRWGGEDLADHRAEAILILGEDYWSRLNERR